MKNKKRLKEHVAMHPVMTFLVMSLVVIVLSGILSLFNVSSTYSALNATRMDYSSTTEAVNSMFRLGGLKYIFSNTVSNFANFTVLPHLIIVLIGIGVMEYSGFLKTAVELLTKKAKKNWMTYIIVLICVLASIMDNLPFVAFIPLSALIYKHGKRNPNLGIITSFAALTSGYGLSLFFTAVDSAIAKQSALSASVLLPNYIIRQGSMMLIMAFAIFCVTIAITMISENVIAKKLPKYEFDVEEEEDLYVGEEKQITKLQIRGLLFAGFGCILYLLIFIYNIIPGLPLSGNFLNYAEERYIDMLFGTNSFFANGSVFIIAMLFIILGLLYGIGAKTIKNNREFIESLGHNLNGIGKTLVFIFAASTFISIFKQTNIGNVVVALLTNIIYKSNFSGLALVIMLFVFSAIATLFVPGTTNRWAIMSSQVIPTFVNVGISAEFTQVIFRFGECMTLGLTPIFAYYVIYLAYLEKYNQEENTTSMFKSFKYQMPYSLVVGGILLAILVLWYVIAIPLGLGGSVNI